jgi:hypothetical protein
MSSTGTKPQLEEPAKKPEDHLFEQETQLEESGVSFRLIAIIAVIVALGVGIGYFFVAQQKDLTAQTATPGLSASLQARGPATISFRVGHVEPSVAEKPRDPHYKLLQASGIVSVKDDKKGGIFSSMTPDGQSVLNAIQGVKKIKNTDGTETYVVPLATRHLTKVDKITMAGVNGAYVEFTWKWKPNVLGQKFDASGALVQKFNSWDRATLIKDYGVDFFNDPKTGRTYMVRGDKGWVIGEEP